MADFSPEIRAVLDDMLLASPHIRAGKMFGFPAYYVGKKLCICLYGPGVGIKLPEISAARLLQEDANIIAFQPMGRPKMRAWVQINLPSPEQYRQYQAVFDEAIHFMLAQPPQ